MPVSNSLTKPTFVLLASLTLAMPCVDSLSMPIAGFSTPASGFSQTISPNTIAQSFASEYERGTLQAEALRLFGEQSYFSREEQETYQGMLAKNSKDVGFSIFDLFT